MMNQLEQDTLTLAKRFFADHTHPNWEERRFELVKVFLPIVVEKNENANEEEIIEIAISAADNTIRHLQKQVTNN